VNLFERRTLFGLQLYEQSVCGHHDGIGDVATWLAGHNPGPILGFLVEEVGGTPFLPGVFIMRFKDVSCRAVSTDAASHHLL